MNESLLKRICVDMLNKNGMHWEGMHPMPHDEMVEEMRYPENIIEFLTMFVESSDIVDGKCGGDLFDCSKCKPDGVKCPRVYLKSLINKKYQIILTRNETSSFAVRTILPGKFTKEQAQKIIDAYNSPNYTMEEIK